MDPNYWGPGTWKLLHCLAEMYPDNPDSECIEKHCTFIRLLGELLPCRVCQQHFLDMMKENPPEPFMKNKRMFQKWLNDRHNQVNERLKKPLVPLKQAKKQMPKIQENEVQMEENNRNRTPIIMLWTGLGVGIFLLLIIIFLSILYSTSGSSQRSNKQQLNQI